MDWIGCGIFGFFEASTILYNLVLHCLGLGFVALSVFRNFHYPL